MARCDCCVCHLGNNICALRATALSPSQMISRMSRYLLIAAATISLIQATPCSAEPVMVVQGTSEGSGQTFRKGASCVVVTAEHVVPNNSPVFVTDSRGVRVRGRAAFQASKLAK